MKQTALHRDCTAFNLVKIQSLFFTVEAQNFQNITSINTMYACDIKRQKQNRIKQKQIFLKVPAHL